MKTITFEELIKSKSWDTNTGWTVITNRDALELLKEVRIRTLIECSEKAKSIDGCSLNGEHSTVDKDSILNLDKNNIII